MATSRKMRLMGVLGLALAASTTIASANSGSLGVAVHGTASHHVWLVRTVFNPSVGKGDLSHRAIQP